MNKKATATNNNSSNNNKDCNNSYSTKNADTDAAVRTALNTTLYGIVSDCECVTMQAVVMVNMCLFWFSHLKLLLR